MGAQAWRNSWRERLLFFCFIGLLFIVGQPAGEAEEGMNNNDKWINTMNEHAKKAYETMEQGCQRTDCYVYVRQQLQQVVKGASHISYAGVTSLEGMRMTSETLMEAMQALHALSPNGTYIRYQVAKVRLVVEALQQGEEPLWMTFKTVALQEVAALKKAVEQRNASEAKRVFQQWNGHYAFIRPAVVVSHGIEKVQTLDSIAQHIKKTLFVEKKELPSTVIPVWEQAVHALFSPCDPPATCSKNTAQTTPAIVLPRGTGTNPIGSYTVWLLGVLLLALGYVVWRNYQGKQGIVRVKRVDETLGSRVR